MPRVQACAGEQRDPRQAGEGEAAAAAGAAGQGGAGRAAEAAPGRLHPHLGPAVTRQGYSLFIFTININPYIQN